MADRVLWASPLPPIPSGVSDYAVELIPELMRRLRVRVVAPPNWRPPDDLPGELLDSIVDPEEPAAAGELEVLHLGNNPHHTWLLERLDRPNSKLVVLHDVVLHHLLVEATLASGDRDGYLESVRRAHPEVADVLAAAREHGISGRRDPFLFPAFNAVTDRVAGVIVHSRWAADTVRRACRDRPVTAVHLAVADPGRCDPQTERRRLGVPPEAFVLMHLGFLTPGKGLPTVLSAVAAARAAGSDVRLALVGTDEVGGAGEQAARRLGIDDAVIATGWLAAGEMRRAPAAADLGVVLRTPSAGEASAAAGRFLACGTPVAVGGRRQFLELPVAACPRLTPGAPASADLARWIVGLDSDRRLERTGPRRQAARKAWSDLYRPELVASQWVDVVSRTQA